VNVAFTLPAAINVYTFSLLLAIGAAAGLTSLAWLANDDARNTHLNAGLWALIGALIGGRILYIGLHWPYFQNRFVEAIQVHRGGLSWAGALLGGMAAIWFTARYSHKPFDKLADLLIPLFFAISISAWLGCWAAGCAYGQPAEAWWSLPAVDEWGVLAGRIPVQLTAILLTSAVFWLTYPKRANFQIPGQAASLFLLGLSAIYFLLTYLRGDPNPVWVGLRWDAWAALGFSTLGMANFLRLRQKQP
jgi:phosphatidylglycerol:prolipoprotein diacylglycerol transferase